jgi:hypothetical protein
VAARGPPVTAGNDASDRLGSVDIYGGSFGAEP